MMKTKHLSTTSAGSSLLAASAMKRHLSTLVSSSLLAAVAIGATSSLLPAGAFTIITNGTSGGNPGGLTKYKVSDLVQGDTFDVYWDEPSLPWLKGIATISINSLTSTAASIGVTLTNNSPVTGTAGNPPTNTPRFTSFGLSVPDFTAITGSTTGGTYLTKQDNSNFPGFMDVDVCATSGNNCAGGGSGGIGAGGITDTFTLSFTGNFGATPTLMLDSFALKIQSGPGGNSFEVPGTPVPEPLTILGAGTAAAFGAFFKRQVAKKRQEDESES